jgi:hypothetical protein
MSATVANWAWPHTPASNCARLVLTGGPFDGEQAAFLPPDLAAPAQIVWSGWFPWGFDAWLYEWHGERTMDRGRTDALLYRPTGRRLPADEVPYGISELAEVWADGAALIVAAFDVPPELIWPGL